MINTEDYVFDFGMYAGRTYKEILKVDPDYIRWCLHTFHHAGFEISDDDKEELERKLSE